jgi:hypothetical protein
MHKSDLLSRFTINIIRSLESFFHSCWQYFWGKTIAMVRSVHNTYTSTWILQLRLIKVNDPDSMCNSFRKWNAQFYYRIWTTQSLRLQGLWTKTLCDNPVTHTIDHIQLIHWPFTCITYYHNKHVKDHMPYA